MATTRVPWRRDEQIAVLDLYCRTPFGRLHRGNPDVIALAKAIGRTPNAVAMKLVNFGSLDPVQRARGVRGLGNVSRDDVAIWKEFENDWESLALGGAEVRSRLLKQQDVPSPDVAGVPVQSQTEAMRQAKVRLVQGFFRDTVLASYDSSCAFCGLCLLELLNASHIIPWKDDAGRRADPRNGIALCALHDRAFDRGLMTVKVDLTIQVSSRARIRRVVPLHQVGLLDLAGKSIRPPSRFAPDEKALLFHNEHIFH